MADASERLGYGWTWWLSKLLTTSRDRKAKAIEVGSFGQCDGPRRAALANRRDVMATAHFFPSRLSQCAELDSPQEAVCSESLAPPATRAFLPPTRTRSTCFQQALLSLCPFHLIVIPMHSLACLAQPLYLRGKNFILSERMQSACERPTWKLSADIFVEAVCRYFHRSFLQVPS